MSLPIQHNQGVIKIADKLWVYKIPRQVYQMFFDMVPNRTDAHLLVEDTKARILRELKVFISEKFPGVVIVNIADLNLQEAASISQTLEPGMYVQLAEGEYTGNMTLQTSLKMLK